MALVVKNPPANQGDLRNMVSILRSGRSPGGGHGNPLQYSCLENPHGLRSQAGYRPRGCKESDKTEWPSTYNKSSPYPNEYLMICMCNAINDLSCYTVIIYKTWTPEQAILANLLCSLHIGHYRVFSRVPCGKWFIVTGLIPSGKFLLETEIRP